MPLKIDLENKIKQQITHQGLVHFWLFWGRGRDLRKQVGRGAVNSRKSEPRYQKNKDK